MQAVAKTGCRLLAIIALCVCSSLTAAPSMDGAKLTPKELEAKTYGALKKHGATVEHKLMKKGALFIVRGPKAKIPEIRKTWLEYWKSYEALSKEGMDPLNSELRSAMAEQKIERDDVEIEDGLVTVMSSPHLMTITKLHRLVTERQHKYEGKAQ